MPTTTAEPDTTTTADSSGPATVAAASYGRETWRLVKRWRKQALPFAAIGATHTIGATSAALAGPVALAPVAVGCAGAVGAVGYAHQKTSRWGQVYAGIAALSSTIGQTAIALDGATGPASAAVWAAGCALAVPWWVRHCEPDPDVTAELVAYDTAKTTAKAEVDPGQRARLWAEHLADAKGALPDSSIARIQGFTYGWKATVTLPVGRHWHEIMNARKAILSVYDLPDGRVFVEALPGESVRKARLTTLTSDPLQTIRRWERPGLDAKTGTAPLMTTADGELLHWRFWWPGEGACHGLVSGVNGSGKTTLLDLLLTEAAASDRVVPFVVDGGGGASLPQWRNRVPLFAETPDDARTLLKYLLRLMDIRRTVLKKQRRAGGGSSLDPSPKMPLLLCVIDEAHKLLMSDDTVDNSDVKRMCEKLTQEGRKFGIALVLSTQVPSAAQLGGSTVLRDQLKGGTVVGLRVTERTSGNMITSGAPMPEGLHELPAEFPNGRPTKGLGYVLTSRMIRARSLLIAGPDEQPDSLWRDTALDADCAAEQAPVLHGDDENSDTNEGEPTPVMAGGNDASADDAVLHALADGHAKNPIALMQATGLSMGAVRDALKRVDA